MEPDTAPSSKYVRPKVTYSLDQWRDYRDAGRRMQARALAEGKRSTVGEDMVRAAEHHIERLEEAS